MLDIGGVVDIFQSVEILVDKKIIFDFGYGDINKGFDFGVVVNGIREVDFNLDQVNIIVEYL